MNATVDETVATWAAERPDLDFASMDTMLRIALLTRANSSASREPLALLGITLAEFDVLATLRRHGTRAVLSPTLIARVAMVKPSGLSHRLGKLESAGLIERVADPDDGRGLLVRITAKGRRVADQAVRIIVEGHDALFDGLDPGELAVFRSVLAEVLTRAERVVGADEPTLQGDK
ncbi:MAG: hypothetical protein RLZZ544_646 [Actinomycetota bacterium]